MVTPLEHDRLEEAEAGYRLLASACEASKGFAVHRGMVRIRYPVVAPPEKASVGVPVPSAGAKWHVASAEVT